MKLIDLTHTFTPDMPVFPGDPSPVLTQSAHFTTDGYNEYTITTVMHVGTHMDGPFHMIAGGRKLYEMEPEKFFGNGIVIDVRGKQTIDASVLEHVEINENSIVLLFTGLGSKYRTPEYFEKNPQLTEDFAQKLVELKVKMVGMDMLGPDEPPFPSHKILLGNEILILENLTNLDQLLNAPNFEIIALPAKIEADSAPVRVIAKIIV